MCCSLWCEWIVCKFQVASIFLFCVCKEDRPERERRKGQDMSENVKHWRSIFCLQQNWEVPMWLQVMNLQQRGTACHHLCTSMHLIAPRECVALIFFLNLAGLCATMWSVQLIPWATPWRHTRLRVRADNLGHIQLQCYIYTYFWWSLYIQSSTFQLMEIHSKTKYICHRLWRWKLVAACRIVSSIDKKETAWGCRSRDQQHAHFAWYLFFCWSNLATWQMVLPCVAFQAICWRFCYQ